MNNSTTIRAWGNSLGIRIPKTILDKLGIKESDELDITTENDAMILRKAFKHRSFKERLSEYDGKIEVEDFDWGEAMGREIL